MPLLARLLLLAPEGADIDRLGRGLECLQIGAFVVDQARGRGVGKLADQVAAADLDRIDAEALRRRIHQALQGEGEHRPRHAAIRRHHAGVGRDAAREHRVFSEVVRARQLGHRHQRLDAAGRRIARVGADVAPDVGVDGEQAGIRVERGAHRVALVARMRGGEEVLVPVLDPGKPAAQAPRQPHEHDVLREELHLLAEAAADIGRDDAQIGLRHAERVGEAGAQHVRHLHRAGERHPAARLVPGRVAAARLERHRRLAARADVDFDHLRGTPESGIEARRAHGAFDDHVALAGVVHLRRRGRERRIDVHHCVFGVDLRLDRFGEILGARRILGDHDGERFADVVDPLAREHRLGDRHIVGAVEQRPDRLHVREIRSGEDERAVGLGDRADAAARHRAAREAHCGGAVRRVGGEAAAAKEQRSILEAAQAAADPAHAPPSAWSSARCVSARTRSLR